MTHAQKIAQCDADMRILLAMANLNDDPYATAVLLAARTEIEDYKLRLEQSLRVEKAVDSYRATHVA